MATTTRVPADRDLAVDPGGSTIDDLELSTPHARRGRAARRVVMALFAAFVALGLLGVLGVRSGTVRDSADGVELSVTYPRITRPGLASPFRMEIRSEAPLPETVEVSVTQDYLAIYDENGLDPDPAEATSDGEMLTWSVNPTPGATRLVLVFDARIEPAVQWRRSGEVRVAGEALPALRVEFTSTVLP